MRKKPTLFIYVNYQFANLGKNKSIMKKIIHFLQKMPPVLFKVSIGGFIFVSVALYFQSCVTSFDAEKFHYHGIAGKTTYHISSDSIR